VPLAVLSDEEEIAGLAALSPRVMQLLASAPSRPNYTYNMSNALMAVIKLTA